jgi:multidrug efflux pump subunit AcrB
VVLVILPSCACACAPPDPSLAVPLSLIGTCGVMYLLGFSLNNLS